MVLISFSLFPIPSDTKLFPWGGGKSKQNTPSPPHPLFWVPEGEHFQITCCKSSSPPCPQKNKGYRFPLLPPAPRNLLGLTSGPPNWHCQCVLVQPPELWDLSQLCLVNKFHDTFNLNILKHTYIHSYMIRQAIEVRTSKFALPKA